MSHSNLPIISFILILIILSILLVINGKGAKNPTLVLNSQPPASSLVKSANPISSATPLPIPTADNTKTMLQLSELQYPNSLVLSSNNQEITYESSDNPSSITDWYKSKIKSLKMNTTSTIITNTDGNILNRIITTNGVDEIDITITKDKDQQTSNIIVKVK